MQTRSGVLEGVWLHSRGWDLTFLTFSAVLAFFPLTLYYVLRIPDTYVNYIVALVVGGPHLYSTFSITFFDRGFRTRHPFFTWSSFLLPAGVTTLALWRSPIFGVRDGMTLLLTVFFFWASLHVLHQIAYLVECYREKQPVPVRPWERLLDHGLIFSSLYPMATYKLVKGMFRVDANTPIPIPPMFRVDATWIAVSGIFGALLVLWLAKTVLEYRQGRLNPGATLLVGTTALVAFWIPWIPKLDVSFQGFNTWHSFQYLAMIWLINGLRKERGEISNRVVAGFSGEGRAPAFYLSMLACTLAAVGGIFAVNRVFGIDSTRSYYIVVLSSLLIHYYQDHLNFFQFGALAGSRRRVAEAVGAR
ncbi:MAG TPA: hypothetical protein VMS93_01885 [Candidatus Saccharimonadales bacterium]|nr:hypothetical protein [Candidatus Saccharimonadales bacterium]